MRTLTLTPSPTRAQPKPQAKASGYSKAPPPRPAPKRTLVQTPVRSGSPQTQTQAQAHAQKLVNGQKFSHGVHRLSPITVSDFRATNGRSFASGLCGLRSLGRCWKVGRYRTPSSRRGGWRTFAMKILFPSVAVLAVAWFVGVGCANKKKAMTPDASVIDVKPGAGMSPTAMDSTAAGPGSTGQPVYEPVAVTQTPVEPAAVAPTSSAKARTVKPAGKKLPAVEPSAGGKSYRVRKGDSLFRIAQEQYGDGGKWQRIATANPDITPHALKPGQTLVIP